MIKLRKGFTLIELLVVIAIIGILAAMILVSLNTARIKAKNARVKSDLTQVRSQLTLDFDAVPVPTTCTVPQKLLSDAVTTNGATSLTCDTNGTGKWNVVAIVPAGGTGGGNTGSMCMDSSGLVTGSAGGATTGVCTATIPSPTF